MFGFKNEFSKALFWHSKMNVTEDAHCCSLEIVSSSYAIEKKKLGNSI